MRFILQDNNYTIGRVLFNLTGITFKVKKGQIRRRVTNISLLIASALRAGEYHLHSFIQNCITTKGVNLPHGGSLIRMYRRCNIKVNSLNHSLASGLSQMRRGICVQCGVIGAQIYQCYELNY